VSRSAAARAFSLVAFWRWVLLVLLVLRRCWRVQAALGRFRDLRRHAADDIPEFQRLRRFRKSGVRGSP